MALAAFLESCLARQTFQGEIRGGIMLARGLARNSATHFFQSMRHEAGRELYPLLNLG